MLAFAETVFSTVGVAGFAALWAVKAGGTVLALRYLKQRRNKTIG